MDSVYKRLVGIIKRSLHTTLGRTCSTVIFKLLHSSQRKSRRSTIAPALVYVTSDSISCALSPGYFLDAHLSVPLSDPPSNEKSEDNADYQPSTHQSTCDQFVQAWKKGQQILTSLWQVWKRDYLISLQEAHHSTLPTFSHSSSQQPQVSCITHIHDLTPCAT